MPSHVRRAAVDNSSSAASARPIVSTPTPTPSVLPDSPGKDLPGLWAGPGRCESLLVALAAAVLLMAYNWLAHVWLDLIDEGYFLEQATRILRGSLPYRDFDTYYTPAAVYLHALTFWITGEQSVIPVRLILAVVRTLTALLLYFLARPLAPPAIAAIPVLIVLVVDPVPIMWEPHPGTYANLAMLAVLAAMADFLERGRRASLILAGLASGIAFAFKQNIGVFAVMAVTAFLLLHQKPIGLGWLGPLGRLGVALALPLAFTALLWRSLDGLYLLTFLVPIYTMCGLMFLRSLRPHTVEVDGRETARQLGLFLGAFGVVTIAWILPLALALGWHEVPWGLFIGRVNKTALVFPLDLPAPSVPYMVLIAAAPLLGFALLRPTGRRSLLAFTGFVGALLLAAAIPVKAPLPLPPDVLAIPEIAALDGINTRIGNQLLYLPSLVFWPTLAVMLVSNGRVTGALGARWWWYLFAGAILMFAQYPRVDEIHLLHSSPPILLAATGLAAAAWRAAPTWSLARALVLAAIVLIPLVSVSAPAAWRAVAILVPDTARPDTREFERLTLERAPVLLPAHSARSYQGVVNYVRERTSGSEPIFVFPVAPMFYFLADRPNPTRYDHLQPGVANEAEQQQMIDDLAHVRFVVWDHLGVADWGTAQAYRPLSDYIWWCFTPTEDFPPFLVLERNERCP